MRHRKGFAVVGLGLAALSLAGCAPRVSADTTGSARDQSVRAIDAARRRLEDGIRSNDAAAMAGVYAPDAFFFPPGEDSVGGREAIRRSFERATRDYEIVHLVHEVDVRGDVAYEVGRWIQRRRNGGAAIGGGGYLWIWKRQPGGSWAIWREVWNDGPPVS